MSLAAPPIIRSVSGVPLSVSSTALAGNACAGRSRQVWTSTEPMSVPSEPLRLGIEGIPTARGEPRWSVVSPLPIPASITGLVNSGSCVWVGPPLLASGPSWASTPVMFVPGGASAIAAPAGFWIRL